MTTVRELHDRAMALADDMIAARHKNATRIAERAARDAFRAELQAATLAFELRVSTTTRIVLLRSAANLAREARCWDECMDLALRALNDRDLRAQREELFYIVDTLRALEHLSLRGIELSPADVQLSVAGPEVAPGFAAADEVNRRVNGVKSLMEYATFRRLGLPFGIRARSQQMRQVLTPYLSEPRAASYAVTVRFGIGEQWDLLPELAESPAGRRRRVPSVARVLDDVIASARAYAEGGPSAIKKLIKEDDYARSAASLLRHLSPDAERIRTVGLTVYRGGRAEPVELPDRTKFDARQPVWFAKDRVVEALPQREHEVEGRLLQGDHVKEGSDPKGSVVLDNGSVVKFHFDEVELGDVIPDYWKQRVRALIRRETKTRNVLLDIKPA